jgi:cyclase
MGAAAYRARAAKVSATQSAMTGQAALRRCDHCWGNQLLPTAEIIGSTELSHGMAEEVQPHESAALSGTGSADTALGAYMQRHFGAFDFTGIVVTPPTRTFSGQLDVAIGDRTVTLIEGGRRTPAAA